MKTKKAIKRIVWAIESIAGSVREEARNATVLRYVDAMRPVLEAAGDAALAWFRGQGASAYAGGPAEEAQRYSRMCMACKFPSNEWTVTNCVMCGKALGAPEAAAP